MAFSTLVSYLAGLGFLRYQSAGIRRFLLIAPVTTDLALLGFFKYSNMILETFNYVHGAVAHSSTKIPLLDIVLPVGISFYTFHTITYVVDSYKRVITPTRNLFEFTCYVSLFAQLVAGPIVRFREIERDLDTIDIARSSSASDAGWSFFAIGLFKKVLIADSIARIIDPPLSQMAALSAVSAWACVIGYSYQLYFDFSGYSDMAVGLGRLFGLRLPQNFNSPYQATDMADFWRRWHMSLSSFLRDYLYIPLGGSRIKPWVTHRNLMITMLLGGLWHGSNWTFVVWGGYHGVLLSLNRVLRAPIERLPGTFRRIATFGLVVVGWVFFRAPTLRTAVSTLRTMLSFKGGLPLFPGSRTLLVLLIVAGAIAHFGRNTFELRHEWSPMITAGFGVLFLISMVILCSGNPSPFLYFQF